MFFHVHTAAILPVGRTRPIIPVRVRLACGLFFSYRYSYPPVSSERYLPFLLLRIQSYPCVGNWILAHVKPLQNTAVSRAAATGCCTSVHPCRRSVPSNCSRLSVLLKPWNPLRSVVSGGIFLYAPLFCAWDFANIAISHRLATCCCSSVLLRQRWTP